MKNILFCIFLLSTNGAAFAQEFSAPDTQRYRNEIGIDATPFIRNILDFDDAPGPNVSSTYYLTYRRYIGRGALRAAVGGFFYNRDTEARTTAQSGPGDTSLEEYRARRVEARLGYEWYTPLAKRWQLYYGADARIIRGSNWRQERSGSGFAEVEQTSEASSFAYGVAPLLGVRFRLTPRISLRTEASFTFLRITDESESRTRFVNPGPVPILDQVSSRTFDGFETSFQQPLSLFINFDL